MRGIVILGIFLIVVGAIVVISQGITYTSKEKVLDVGPIEATKESTKRIPVSPIVGGAAIVGGVALVLSGARRG